MCGVASQVEWHAFALVTPAVYCSCRDIIHNTIRAFSFDTHIIPCTNA